MTKSKPSLFMLLLYSVMIMGGAAISYYIYTAKSPAIDAAHKPFISGDTANVAIMTSLPLFSPEAANIADALGAADKPDAEAHPLGVFWSNTLSPEIYDDLTAALSFQPDLLILAQSRPFSPEQLAQFDAWVRGGGKALVFADPALFWPSIFSVGDARRPEGATLLSPLFAYWGLEQQIDDDQPEGAWSLADRSNAMIVVQSGHFIKSGNSDAQCTLHYGDAVAACNVGKGRAVLVSDADMLQVEFYPVDGTEAHAPILGSGNWNSVASLLQLAAG